VCIWRIGSTSRTDFVTRFVTRSVLAPRTGSLAHIELSRNTVFAERLLTGKALAYLDGQWPKLIRVLEDGRLPLDTNRVENAIRPFVIGRKAS